MITYTDSFKRLTHVNVLSKGDKIMVVFQKERRVVYEDFDLETAKEIRDEFSIAIQRAEEEEYETFEGEGRYCGENPEKLTIKQTLQV